MIVPPGSTIGIIGGGQLGRMLAIAAARLGYDCHIFAPEADPPAARVAARATRAAYDDLTALRAFADAVDVATYEFENLPAGSLAELGDKLRPGTASLAIAQDRAAEKSFIEANGGTVARWLPVDSAAAAAAAEQALGLPLVLKSRRLGYDGKGQAWAREPGSTGAAWEAIGRAPAVAEAAVDFAAEYSVVLARSASGETTAWDVPLNHHEGGILRRSTVPAGAPIDALAALSVAIAAGLADALGHIGVLTVEFFATADGPIVNEIAPRSQRGHWTIDGAATSQFEQHLRAICGCRSARGAASRRRSDCQSDRRRVSPAELLAEPGAFLHLSAGRSTPRPQDGSLTRLADSRHSPSWRRAKIIAPTMQPRTACPPARRYAWWIGRNPVPRTAAELVGAQPDPGKPRPQVEAAGPHPPPAGIAAPAAPRHPAVATPWRKDNGRSPRVPSQRRARRRRQQRPLAGPVMHQAIAEGGESVDADQLTSAPTTARVAPPRSCAAMNRRCGARYAMPNREPARASAETRSTGWPDQQHGAAPIPASAGWDAPRNP